MMKLSMKYPQNLIAISLCAAISVVCVPAWAIKKCQDADGNWHYGDVAVDACNNSSVTTLNDRGFVTEQEAAPKSAEELRIEQEQQAAEEAERTRLKEEEDERIRILSVYETEADIDRQRDNQVSSVQGNIVVHEAYLKSMATRIERMKREQAEVTAASRKEQIQADIDSAYVRVARSEKELAELTLQKESIIQKFAKEKEIYLALKNSN